MTQHTREADSTPNRLKELLYSYDVETLELAISFLAIVMGTWLLLPFGEATTSASANIILAVFGKLGFGGMVLFGGLVRFYGLYTANLRVQIYATFYCAMIWLFIASTVAYSNPTSFGVAIFGGLFLVSGFMYIRLKDKNKREKERVFYA